MKKFRFSFERLMDWRDKQAEQEKTELQRLRRINAELVIKRQRLLEEMGQTSLSLASGSGLSGGDLRHAAAFLQALQASERTVQAEQTRCAAAIEAQLQRCIAADRDFKLLERVREKRLAEWQADMNRETDLAAEEAWQSGRTRAANTSPAGS